MVWCWWPRHQKARNYRMICRLLSWHFVSCQSRILFRSNNCFEDEEVFGSARNSIYNYHQHFISDRKSASILNDWFVFLICLVFNDLEHPPPTYVSSKYAWRTADGSFNNVSIPDLGKSNTPYARSVQQKHPLPAHMLPDPGLVFDSLLKREAVSQISSSLNSSKCSLPIPYFAVCPTPGWLIFFDVLVRSACHSHVLPHVS